VYAPVATKNGVAAKRFFRTKMTLGLQALIASVGMSNLDILRQA